MPALTKRGQRQTDDMMRVADAPQIDLGPGRRATAAQILRFQMIFTILIVKLVVRIEFLRLPSGAFLSGQPAFPGKIMRALVAEALVNGFTGASLPDGQHRTAVRTEIPGLGSSTDTFAGSETAADFAANLIPFPAVIEIKKVGGRIAAFAPAMLRNTEAAATSDRLQQSAGSLFKGRLEFTPVGADRRQSRWKRRGGVDRKLAVVLRRRFRFEFKSAPSPGKYLKENRNNGGEFIAGKLPAKPFRESVKRFFQEDLLVCFFSLK